MSFSLKPTKEKLLEIITSSDKLKQVADYFQVSQQSVIKWMKSYDIFESHNFKRNIGQGKPWLGKSLSDETKNKISETKSGVVLGPRIRIEEHSCKCCGKSFKRGGKFAAQEFCSRKCVDTFRKGSTYEEYYGLEKSQEIIGKFIKTMCEKEMFYVSKPHRILKDAMISNNLYVGFKTSQPILYFEIDELNEQLKIAIEVDGDYWHRLTKKQIADKRKNTFLANRGYTVLRFWESEIYRDLDNCLEQIKGAINAKITK